MTEAGNFVSNTSRPGHQRRATRLASVECDSVQFNVVKIANQYLICMRADDSDLHTQALLGERNETNSSDITVWKTPNCISEFTNTLKSCLGTFFIKVRIYACRIVLRY